mmetsp:Transcript_23876/g.28871  ORF Transcript_23876/g.28871 Transcript_23876/m.28871 type:complete len:478 (-) Transcript_23876:201-1634(-)|eukprot:CAMPEP_0197852012 /NCGR_PEP_ID=MMETSP1438-20131217/19464_1 /TAXON_ID=1461541 /ORGANISM="Pterosperma sp., Strain CCMP1384" /LENGTH=477 /DNA_ID=CAMNT_0043465849 /DNA_START=98 /DNA_END=1531 /DNA_ORIENTATION=+
MTDVIRQDEIFLTAVNSGNADKVREMLSKGAVPNLQCQHSATPLHWAAINDHAEVVKVLVEWGAKIDEKADDGCTPLHFACREDCIDAAKILLEAGADPNVRNANGSTPFDCIYDDEDVPELVDLLKEHGWSPNAKPRPFVPFPQTSNADSGTHEVACGGDSDDEIDCDAGKNARPAQPQGVLKTAASEGNSGERSVRFSEGIEGATAGIGQVSIQAGDDARSSESNATTPALSMRCLNGVLAALEGGDFGASDSNHTMEIDISSLEGRSDTSARSEAAGTADMNQWESFPPLSMNVLTGVLSALGDDVAKKEKPGTQACDVEAKEGAPDINEWESIPKMSMDVLSGVLAALDSDHGSGEGKTKTVFVDVDEDGNECGPMTIGTDVSIGTEISVGSDETAKGTDAGAESKNKFGLSMSEDPFASAFAGPGFLYGYDGDGGNNVFQEEKKTKVVIDRSEMNKDCGTVNEHGRVEIAIG